MDVLGPKPIPELSVIEVVADLNCAASEVALLVGGGIGSDFVSAAREEIVEFGGLLAVSEW
jgi:hypothetical protein